MANLIGEHMSLFGTKFINGTVPSSLTKPDPEGKIHVKYSKDGEEITEQYDTVLFAVGRYALTANLGLDKAGV